MNFFRLGTLCLSFSLFACANQGREAGTRIPLTEKEIRFVMSEDREEDVVQLLRDPGTSYWEERTCWNDACGTYRCSTLNKVFSCYWTEEARELRAHIDGAVAAEPAQDLARNAGLDENAGQQSLAKCEALRNPDSLEQRRECIGLLWSKYSEKDPSRLRKALSSLCSDGKVYCNLGGKRIGGAKVRPRYPQHAALFEREEGDAQALEYFEKE